MYIKGGEYLGEYSNNDLYAPLQGSDNFGLDDYEPEFFLDFLTWKTAGKYEIALKFDVDDFTQDIFYFCHVSIFFFAFLCDVCYCNRNSINYPLDLILIVFHFFLL